MTHQNASPFQNLPKDLNNKEVLVLDGIGQSLDIFEFAYQSLHQELFAHSIDSITKSERSYMPAFANAWTTIDFVARLFKALKSYHRLEELTSVKAFIGDKDVGAARRLRNQNQHFDEKFENLLEKRRSIWGNLLWCFIPQRFADSAQFDAHVLTSGITRSTFVDFPMPEGEIQIDRGIANVYLDAFDVIVSISELRKVVSKVRAEVEASLKQEFAGKETRLNRQHLCMSFATSDRATPEAINVEVEKLEGGKLFMHIED